MAEENQVPKNKNEQTEFEAKKPLIDAFRDLFKRPAALPGEIPSKHKTTNIDMMTSMSFREFRANLIKSVGDFFQSLSKIGSSKKEENLNKIPKESVSSQNVEKATEKTRNDDENIVSQQPIRIPGQVSIQNVRTVPAVEHINVDKAVAMNINKAKAEESAFESDSSSDGAPAGTDIIQEPEKKSGVQNVVIMAETMIAGEAEVDDKKNSKSITPKRTNEPDQRDL